MRTKDKAGGIGRKSLRRGKRRVMRQRSEPALEPELAPPPGPTLAKVHSGITGLDEITGGGLPKGRPTLVCGGPGCGKTLFGIEFLVRGATDFNEPGALILFEENEQEITENVRSLGFDLKALVAQKKLFIDSISIDRSELEEAGDYDLEGLFIRLDLAIRTVGAKRVVLDTLEALLAGFGNEGVLRAELRRLFRWFKARGLTAVITSEQGRASMTRYGLEEYVADCVIALDHRVDKGISTRRLRVVKYRGALHGTNEYPFLIGETGFTVSPITSINLEHGAPTTRVSSGIPKLDQMLGGEGYYRGSSILVSGCSGTGKSSIAAHFCDASCRRGERCLLLAYEESQSQIVRNMNSIGIDLQPWLKNGLLEIHATRPSQFSLELHLTRLHQLVERFEPASVAIDPISNLMVEPNTWELKPMLMLLLDFLKQRQITGLFTALTDASGPLDSSQLNVSSLMDAWLRLSNVDAYGERNRTLYILKARGLAHSNQVREFLLTNKGVDLQDVYLSGDQVVTGSARVAKQAREEAESTLFTERQERHLRQAAIKQQVLRAKIAALEAEAQGEKEDAEDTIAQEDLQQKLSTEALLLIARQRSNMGGTAFKKP